MEEAFATAVMDKVEKHLATDNMRVIHSVFRVMAVEHAVFVTAQANALLGAI
jgi:hypothetical protein